MKTRTEQILKVMNVLAWIAFIGLMIEAGAVLVCYGISYFNPDAAKNLYRGWNLYHLKQFSGFHYTVSVFFDIALSTSRAFLCFLVIKTLSKVKLANPFTLEITAIIEQISYILVVVGLLAGLNDLHAHYVLSVTGIIEMKVDAGGHIFVAGLVFIIAQIFKRGIELQTENDLTV
ncbi:DUF2975 domain-containing protein [Mucilaginibacter sp. UYCu711]|uniref:DUF2975 domain-containing protein n=1 Tax=Mucilaginibacter sp. UYCu711 TaxID=3156339 RepID=UPI003D216502